MLEKTSIRQTMKTLRKINYVFNPDASHSACKIFLQYNQIKKNDLIGVYWPFNFELDTRPLIKYLSEKEIDLALPFIKKKRMIFKKWKISDKLEPTKYNFFAPLDSSTTVKPSIILVPCLAYDQNGNRVGYGKGFYDKYYYSNKKSKYIGFAYKFQAVEILPTNKYDLKLNSIVNECNFYKIEN